MKDCLEQAGGKGLFDKKIEAKPSELTEDTEVDILIIGGGASGCMAALSASSENLDLVDSGVSVMLVEKQAMFGGSAETSALYCSGYSQTYAGAWAVQC